ncbi:hypothetical protein PY093_19855 [Cytobacillus sp. S13-E01]|uniref:YkvI family membrane protein n=1 Tax=Cytobacillus sp. S13-E01 TaxID=3031326 RepID=UPI0023D7F7A4|nr:hypothetical protein [Cytobacillus sp. S13-E01]MDF0728871.1 hypothetical protein [Cytobacillus sp. S13-E01]
MNKTTATEINVFKVAATYIGTVVGAGFASGQEVLQFFSAYGMNGILGIIISTFLFFFFGYTILIIGQALKVNSYVEVVRFSNGKFLGTIIDIIITIFLFGALAAMIAGAGAIFDEQFNISPLWGTLLMAIISLLTVITGIKGVINAISYVVPVLLVSVFFIAIYSLSINPITSADLQIANTLEGAAPNWVISALNYTSYNLVIAVAVLAPMGAKAKSRKTLFWGALLGGLGLGVGVVAIFLSILTNLDIVVNVEVPMIMIASTIATYIQIIFAVVLFAEVYTTAVGNLYGFVSRMNFIPDRFHIWVIVGSTIAAFLVSQIGFSAMVKYLYPAVGYGGLLFFAGLLYVWIFKRSELNERSK